MDIQRNKLGICDFFLLEDIEHQIVSMKLSILDSTFTFNCEKFDLTYMERLHAFLFGDIYYFEDLQISNVYSLEELEKVNQEFSDFNQKLLQGDISLKEFKEFFYHIWQYQFFYDGNTRTVLGMMKVYIDSYQLPFFIDTNDDLLYGGEIFKSRKLFEKPLEKFFKEK